MMSKYNYRPWGWWRNLYKGPGYLVKINSIHRAKGGKGNLLIVETQHGDKLSEDDIERFEDDYGRVTKVKDDTKT